MAEENENSGTPQTVQSTSSVTSREADGRLLDIVSGQLLTVARTLSHFTLWFVIVGLLCVGGTGFSVYKMYEVSKVNEQTKKQIWELKKALSLQFSDERSRGKSQTEMP